MNFLCFLQDGSVDELEGEFTSFDNTGLYYRAWVPETPEGLVLYLHGAFSHAGEATFPAKHLADQLNLATYAFDQRGWGHWEGTAGHITNREQLTADVLSFYDFIQTNHPDLPVILIGHSMGGMIGLRVLIDHADKFVCAIFSSPWIASRVQPPFLIKLFSSIFSVIWPTYSDTAPFKVDELTHDNAVIAQHYREIEEGIRKIRATARWFVEISKLQEEVKEGAEYIRHPVLIMQAGQDLLVKDGASKDIFNKIDSEKKKWMYYPNMYHELFNELDREEPLNETSTYIDTYLKTV